MVDWSKSLDAEDTAVWKLQSLERGEMVNWKWEYEIQPRGDGRLEVVLVQTNRDYVFQYNISTILLRGAHFDWWLIDWLVIGAWWWNGSSAQLPQPNTITPITEKKENALVINKLIHTRHYTTIKQIQNTFQQSMQGLRKWIARHYFINRRQSIIRHCLKGARQQFD